MPIVFATPPISLSTAHALAAFFAVSYVGSLYLSRNARLSFKKSPAPQLREGEQRRQEREERWRNDPDVIRARLLAASLSTVTSCLVVQGTLWRLVGGGFEVSLYAASMHNFLIALESTLARLGFSLDFDSSSPLRALLPCLVTPVLFLGPLYADFLGSALPFQRHWTIARSLWPIIGTWQGLRNYVVGPITEEMVFRSCAIAIYHLAGVSLTSMIFLTPLIFGIAHLHHAWEIFNRYGRTASAARRALLASVFQLSYTTLFGAHCAFLFLRSGSLLPPLAAHAFCNIMGVPQYTMHVAYFPQRRTAIKAAYLLGIVGYVYTLAAWTRAEDSLYWPRGAARPRY
ncbi:hypothetical protein B0H21DRAFT_812760 [Amylocystis lapponica]|nr:hypothetical protein B0H21DRAFT_812760 [Amylocystis lapponica]